MNKTCNGCKALHTEGHERCEIGYKIEHVLKSRGVYNYYESYAVPLEKCPKPTKYSELIAIQLGNKEE